MEFLWLGKTFCRKTLTPRSCPVRAHAVWNNPKPWDRNYLCGVKKDLPLKDLTLEVRATLVRT